MYYILSSLLGIFVKLFDDIIDMQILIDPYYINLLKYLIICISTLICINDYNFGIINTGEGSEIHGIIIMILLTIYFGLII